VALVGNNWVIDRFPQTKKNIENKKYPFWGRGIYVLMLLIPGNQIQEEVRILVFNDENSLKDSV